MNAALQQTVRRLDARNRDLLKTVEVLLTGLAQEQARAKRLYELGYTQGRRNSKRNLRTRRGKNS